MIEAPVLEVDALEVRYGDLPAVRGLSMHVEAGEIVGVVGPNGAGKTTTMLAIMGAVGIVSGDVRHAGASLRGQAPEEIVRAGLALVPEGRHIFPEMTVEENLRLGARGRRSNDGLAADRAWVGELFPVVDEFAQRPAGLLSGGQQQQVAIGRALLAQPAVLLLDEPSLGLSPALVTTVLAALRAIQARGVTIVLVEQRAQLAVGFADRTYVMSRGAVALTLTPADAGDSQRMIEAYFG